MTWLLYAGRELIGSAHSEPELCALLCDECDHATQVLGDDGRAAGLEVARILKRYLNGKGFDFTCPPYQEPFDAPPTFLVQNLTNYELYGAS